MIELICRAFLTAFLVFYSATVLVLLAGIIHGALRGRRKRARVVRMPDRMGSLTLSPKTQRH